MLEDVPTGVVSRPPNQCINSTAEVSWRTAMSKLVDKLFHLICVKDYRQSDQDTESYFIQGFQGAETFFGRFDGHAAFQAKDVLDFGCGYGSTSFYMAQRGARSVTGIDIDEQRIQFAKAKLASAYGVLSSVVRFYLPETLPAGQHFDMIVSKDCFEHYANPEAIVGQMKRYLKPDGVLVIGFTQLWKAPYGGHISFMTKLPWAHLIFPEEVIAAERRRFRPEEEAKTFAEMRGGLNQMTLARFLQIMQDSALKFQYFRINVSTSKLMKLFNLLRRIPFCQECFTQSIYSVMRPKGTCK
jgi:2-polyprenyl-3-methyl-5-hydroxy-6-metoxy-1,4-benzoquinol methylase